jgi:hypothetical protein
MIDGDWDISTITIMCNADETIMRDVFIQSGIETENYIYVLDVYNYYLCMLPLHLLIYTRDLTSSVSKASECLRYFLRLYPDAVGYDIQGRLDDANVEKVYPFRFEKRNAYDFCVKSIRLDRNLNIRYDWLDRHPNIRYEDSHPNIRYEDSKGPRYSRTVDDYHIRLILNADRSIEPQVRTYIKIFIYTNMDIYIFIS